jgi:hypothetical protein
MIEWLDRNENLCAAAIKNDQSAKSIWSETMTRTTNDPDKRARNADLVPYTMMERVLNEMTCLDPSDSNGESTEHLRKYFEPVYLWISTIQEAWETGVCFATHDGRIGYSNAKILEGDRLCMFYSGRLLYILRELRGQNLHEKRFHFVSVAYVFDHMDGEVFDMLADGVLTEEHFHVI